MVPSLRSFAVIPAAGASVRMGRPKLLMPWGESTVIQQTLSAWRASQVTEIIVVVRPGDNRLAAACEAAGVHVCVPALAPPEMKVSVQHGLRYVEDSFHPDADDVWLLAPADMPLLTSGVIDRVLECRCRDDRTIVLPAVGGKAGHPVMFPWSLSTEVFGLSDREGVNALLSRHPTRHLDISDKAILIDLDTPVDYQRLRSVSGNSKKFGSDAS